MNVQELNKIITLYSKDTPIMFRKFYPDGYYADYSIQIHEFLGQVCITAGSPIEYETESTIVREVVE